MFNFFKKKKEEEYRPQLPLVYSEEEMDAIEEHITKCFGKFDNVFHEIASPDIHVDICVIPPDETRDYYTLVTMGMGAHKMNIPPELKEYGLDRAELIVYLPSYWKIDMESFQDENWYWPVRTLKSTARLPLNYDTWLGWGHTVGLGEGETYAPDTEFCSCILVSPGTDAPGEYRCVLPNGERVLFFAVVPLYKDELDYKLNHDAEDLIDFITDSGLIIDPHRKSFFSGESPLS